MAETSYNFGFAGGNFGFELPAVGAEGEAQTKSVLAQYFPELKLGAKSTKGRRGGRLGRVAEAAEEEAVVPSTKAAPEEALVTTPEAAAGTLNNETQYGNFAAPAAGGVTTAPQAGRQKPVRNQEPGEFTKQMRAMGYDPFDEPSGPNVDIELGTKISIPQNAASNLTYAGHGAQMYDTETIDKKAKFYTRNIKAGTRVDVGKDFGAGDLARALGSGYSQESIKQYLTTEFTGELGGAVAKGLGLTAGKYEKGQLVTGGGTQGKAKKAKAKIEKYVGSKGQEGGFGLEAVKRARASGLSDSQIKQQVTAAGLTVGPAAKAALGL